MQENDFEKQVKEAMEGFSLTPSQPVWNKIEQQLPRQKRRRRFIVFFFLFAGLLAGGYFLYHELNEGNKSNNNNLATVTKNANDTLTNKTAEKQITETNKIASSEQQSIQKEQAVVIPTYKTPTLQSSTKQFNKQEHSAVPQSFENVTNNIPATNLSDAAITTVQQQIADNKETALHTEPADNIDVAPSQPAPSLQTDEVVVGVDTTAVATAIPIQPDSLKLQSLKDTSFAATTTAKKQPVKIDINKKWQWGITASYGGADVVENFFNLGTSFEKNYDYASPGSVGGGGQNNYDRYNFNVSKQVKAKGSYTAGIALKKQLTARSSFISGIQYTNLRTQIETGIKKDTTAVFLYNNEISAPFTSLSSFYKPGYGNSHINNYHFIELPFIYQHQLNRSQKFAVNWNAGITLSQLIASNAIVFDYTNQAFYNNNKLLHKTQVGMLAGLNMQFNYNKHTAINIGPQFQYNLTNLFRNSSYGKQHLISYGLKASVFLKK
ncbi:MAG: hypothetical protein ABI921_03855 [Panacibacter sp.]